MVDIILAKELKNTPLIKKKEKKDLKKLIKKIKKREVFE